MSDKYAETVLEKLEGPCPDCNSESGQFYINLYSYGYADRDLNILHGEDKTFALYIYCRHCGHQYYEGNNQVLVDTLLDSFAIKAVSKKPKLVSQDELWDALFEVAKGA